MADDIEWDPNEAAANFNKHGINFAEAALVLGDENTLPLRWRKTRGRS